MHLVTVGRDHLAISELLHLLLSKLKHFQSQIRDQLLFTNKVKLILQLLQSEVGWASDTISTFWLQHTIELIISLHQLYFRLSAV